jgi:hypothetical protein
MNMTTRKFEDLGAPADQDAALGVAVGVAGMDADPLEAVDVGQQRQLMVGAGRSERAPGRAIGHGEHDAILQRVAYDGAVDVERADRRLLGSILRKPDSPDQRGLC